MFNQVRVESSRRLTLRNRRFLRRFSKHQPTAFVTLPVGERDGVDMEPEPMSAARQARQVGTSEGRDEHGGVGDVHSQVDVPVHGVEDVHAKQPVQLVREEQLVMTCTWTWMEVGHQLISRMVAMLWLSLVWPEL